MRRALRISTLFGGGLLSAVGLIAGMALAGPASYDKESKSFRFRYTFANLPSGVQSVVGGVDVKPTPEQESTVRGLVGLVSDVLNQVTQGRGKIGSADYVDDIKDADLVVSLTGAPSSPGWSTMKGSDGNPGQMVLYYQTLATTTKQDVVFTAAHEMCHYLFGLADEYNYGNFPNGCPPQPGPGCLMDNYRPGMRGFMGKLCETNHNSQNTQVKSCKALVDDYFAAHGVTAIDPNITPFVPDDRPTVIASAISQTRAEAAKKSQSRSSGSLGSTLSTGLRTFASKTLKTLIDQFNQNNGNKLIFTPAQLRTAVDLISKAGAVLPALRPAGLSPENFAKIKAQAEAIGASPEIKTKKTDSARFTAIKSRLRAYVRQLVKTDPGNAGLDATEQTVLIDRLAREESRNDDQKKLDRLVSVTNVQAELDLVTAENIITVLDELSAPGTPRRLEILGNFRKRFSELSIPGRTSAGFGLRRTRFITPDPIDPAFFTVLTQGGVFSYPVIRDRGFTDFARLVDRARIELVRPNFSQDPNATPAPVDPRIDRPFEAVPVAELLAMKQRNNSDLQAFLNDILNQLDRNRLENIGVLVPPGNLPPELGEMLQVLKTKLSENLDVRLDIVLVGAGDVDEVLRDLAIRSHGSVLTVTDIDEVGAIAQRLKNDQSSGSWVTIPQPSTLPQRKTPRLTGKAAFDAITKNLKESDADLCKLECDIDSIKSKLEDIKNVGVASTMRDSLKSVVDNVTMLKTSFVDLRTIVNQNRFRGRPVTPLDQVNPKDSPKTMELFLKAILDAKVQISQAKQTIIAAREPKIALSLQEIAKDGSEAFGTNLAKLDAVIQKYERLGEAALEVTKTLFPIYRRIDRVALENARYLFEKAAMGNSEPPNKARLNVGDPTQRPIDLERFYAEKIEVGQKDADLELIVGLSRPLPAVQDPETSKVEAPQPTLELYSGAALYKELTPDKSASSETLLVYRVPSAFPLPEGWYDPMLKVDPRILKSLVGTKVNGEYPEDDWNDINFTFSVGSNRRNIQLITSLVQDQNTPRRGTLSRSDGGGFATLEVQVSAGSSVLGARVEGFYQTLTRDEPGTIAIKSVRFADNGIAPDKIKDDGIYTATIDIHSVLKETEFRVFVVADTTDGRAHYIGLDDPNRGDQVPDPLDIAAIASTKKAKDGEAAIREKFDTLKIRAEKDTQAAEGTAIRFQRATTIHFRVKP
jgi:hypothetical protein